MSNKLALLALSLLSLGMASCGPTPTSNPGGIEVNKLIVGLECDYAPFNWTEISSNDFTLPIANVSGQYADGYDVQIAKKLSQELQIPVEIYKEDWEALIPDLQTNTINVVIAGMTDTEERRESIAFTNEYYRSELVLIVKKEVADSNPGVLNQDQLTTLLMGKGLLSQVSTVTNDVIDIFKDKCGAIHYDPQQTFALAALDVSNGSAFAMTAEYPVAQSIVASNSSLGILHLDQTILGDSLAELGVSIGIHKNHPKLQEALNVALNKISQDERNDLMVAAVSRSTEGE